MRALYQLAMPGGLVVLAWSYAYTQAGEGRPPALVAIITPANLFTGVLACGFVCLLVASGSDAIPVLTAFCLSFLRFSP